jgi:hypothetical protein
MSCPNLYWVNFADPSSLTEIESNAFWWSSLKVFCLPASTEFVSGSTFGGCRFSLFLIEEGNVVFRREGNLLLGKSGSVLVRSLDSDEEVEIPSCVETLADLALSGNYAVSRVTFQSPPSVRIIKLYAFRNSHLQSICIPASLSAISGSAFIGCQLISITVDPHSRYFRMLNDLLVSTKGELVRYFGSGPVLRIPDEIRIFGHSCFHSVRTLREIQFGPDSQLRVVEELAFAQCSLPAIAFPMHLETLPTNAFDGSSVGQKSIDARNPWLQIHGDFLCDCGQRRLLAYLGANQAIVIPDEIEIIGRSCFARSRIVRSIAFVHRPEFESLRGRRFWRQSWNP